MDTSSCRIKKCLTFNPHPPNALQPRCTSKRRSKLDGFNLCQFFTQPSFHFGYHRLGACALRHRWSFFRMCNYTLTWGGRRGKVDSERLFIISIIAHPWTPPLLACLRGTCTSIEACSTYSQSRDNLILRGINVKARFWKCEIVGNRLRLHPHSTHFINQKKTTLSKGVLANST